jgi:hypothetical protein
MNTTSNTTLIATINWFTSSKIFPANHRLAIRLSLSMDIVTQIPLLYTEAKLQANSKINIITKLFELTLKYAKNSDLKLLLIPQIKPPPIWQWCYPLGIIIITITCNFIIKQSTTGITAL